MRLIGLINYRRLMKNVVNDYLIMINSDCDCEVVSVIFPTPLLLCIMTFMDLDAGPRRVMGPVLDCDCR